MLMNDPIEELWDALLSRAPEDIREVFIKLESDQQQAVFRHLKRMVSESGWHSEQRESAKVALEALADLTDQEPD